MARTLFSSATILGFLMLAPMACANWSERARVTFKEPVEIPGRVLKPGTYVFKGFDSTGVHAVVQILRAGENSPIATLETLPVYRRTTRTKPVITFEDRSATSPKAVHELFFRNENYGHEFIYQH